MFDAECLSNGLVAFLFGVTGPMVVLITVSTAGGLDPEVINSWIFVGYGLGGAMTVLASLWLRQPLFFHFSIPGTVLLGPALLRFSIEEIVGAYLATAILVVAIGLCGLTRRFMAMIPMPIVMGMVAGVFLPLGIKIITAFKSDLAVAAVTLIAFLVISMLPRIGRMIPPVLAALVCGFVAIAVRGGFENVATIAISVADPLFFQPRVSLAAMAELVIPLTVTVVAINNAQTFAILRNAKFEPAENGLTIVSGLGSVIFGFMGSGSACAVGVMTGIVCGSGNHDRRYQASALSGFLFLIFGILSPTALALALALPGPFIGLLGGLALLGVLKGAFATAFKEWFQYGALTAFLVTISGITIFNIGAPFWGLVAGLTITWCLERDEIRKHAEVAANE